MAWPSFPDNFHQPTFDETFMKAGTNVKFSDNVQTFPELILGDGL